MCHVREYLWSYVLDERRILLYCKEDLSYGSKKGLLLPYLGMRSMAISQNYSRGLSMGKADICW